MDILVIFPFPHQTHLIFNLKNYLVRFNINVSYLCLTERGIDFSKSSNDSFMFKILCHLMYCFNYHCKINILSKFFKILLNFFLKQYDLIDFHVPIYYYKIITNCIRNNINFDVTLWGSELLRADENRKIDLYYYLCKCRKIKCDSPTLYNCLEETYSKYFSKKTMITIFGNSNIEDIDRLKEEDLINFKNKYLVSYVNNSIIVVLGYNACNAQNHIIMINAIKKLPDYLKKQIHIILPMTYAGLNFTYLEKIKKHIEESGCNYTLLTEFMSNIEVAALRKLTNIFVEMQSTDSFSATIQCYLYCENTVSIIADWLSYPLLKDAFFLKTNYEDLVNCLTKTISNYNEIVTKCKGNSKLIKKITSWDNAVVNWYRAYTCNLS